MNYKFRGKEKDNGEWVDGYYAIVKGRHFIIPDDAVIFQGYEDCIANIIEVIPETVGIFIDKTDNSGKEIYEGDKIYCDNFPPDNIIIEWNQEYCKFGGYYKSNWGRSFVGMEHLRHSEIIGNVWDSKEKE